MSPPDPRADRATRGSTDLPEHVAPTVLLVGDDPLVLKVLERACVGWGYPVLTSADPRAAVALLESRPEIACVISELEMRDLDGAELLGICERVRPELVDRFVLQSAWPRPDRVPAHIPFLRKPVPLRAVRATIDGVLLR